MESLKDSSLESERKNKKNRKNLSDIWIAEECNYGTKGVLLKRRKIERQHASLVFLHTHLSQR
jgi:hypothetical protein